MNIRKLLLTSSALGALALLAACSSSSAQSSKGYQPINYGLGSNILTLDSSLATDGASLNTLENVEVGLTQLVGRNAVPALAESITNSSDGLTYTIKLRSGLKWSNGDALTVKDFLYAWQRAVNPKTGSQYAYYFDNIKNATAIEKGKLPVTDLGVKIIGDDTLQVSLTKPTPYFNQLLQAPAYFPLNQKFVEKEGKSYGTTSDKTLYDGPYKFVTASKAWTGSNKNFTIVKNNNFYNASKVKTPEINYQVIDNPNTAVSLYKSGKLDLAFLSSNELIAANKNDKGYTNLAHPFTYYIEFNSSKVKALANQNIRQAINLATNRQEIVTAAAPSDRVATSLTPYGLSTFKGQDFSDYAKQNYTYDEKLAQQYWQKGLAQLGLKTLTLSLEGADDDNFSKATLTYLQTSLAKTLPGLTIQEKLVPSEKSGQDASNGNFQLILDGWGADYLEPSNFVNLFLTGGPFNSGKFSDASVDKAYQEASTVPDVLSLDKRTADYKKVEQALYEHSDIDPIAYSSGPVLINPSLKNTNNSTNRTVAILDYAYKE